MAARIISSSRAGLGSVAVIDSSSSQTQIISNVGAYVSPVSHIPGTTSITLLQNFIVHPSFGAIKVTLLQNFKIQETSPFLQKPPVMFDRTTIQDSLHSIVTASAQDGFMVRDHDAALMAYHYNLISRISLQPAIFPAWNAVINLVQNLTVHLSASQKYIWGRILTQAFKVSAAVNVGGRYLEALAQLFKLSDADGLSHTIPLVLSQNISLSLSLASVAKLKLLQNFLISATPSTKFTYHLALAGQVVINGLIDKLYVAILTQLFNVHPALSRSFIANGSLAQLLTLHPAFTSKLVLKIVGNLTVSPSQLVSMIYKGDALLDGVVITALYISPSGMTTTWVVNTRTNAVTEYMNYNFRSFTKMGDRYIAAGDAGLYELDGDTDDGTSIISELMSGYLQLNEKKLFGIKGAYVAIRGGGRFYLKLISGDGREYVYELRAQPNLMSTKVRVGKGISTTYMAFDLITEGQDFDLDSVEFIPMTRGRRV